MGTEAGEPEGVELAEPPRRRTTFVPRPSEHDAAANESRGAASEVHDDDELAGALENEVSLLTASLPIIRPQSLFLPVRPPEPAYEPRTDAEREIAAQAESGDTLAAIERLEELLAGRHTPAAEPGRRSAEPQSTSPQSTAQLVVEQRPAGRRPRLWLWFAAGASVLVAGGVGTASWLLWH
jgi:hypothetical protein